MNDQPAKDQKHLLRLLGAANFLAACGGGAILGVGEEAFKIPGQIIETFLLGTTFGLGLLLLLRARASRGARPAGCWFSFAGGAVSLAAAAALWLHIAPDRSDSHGAWAWAIYFLLSLRFSLWFVARVQRPDMVAGRERKVGWVELYYYVGVISGVILASALRVGADFIWLVMVMDGLSQWVAGVFDLRARRHTPAREDDKAQAEQPLPYSRLWYACVVLAVVTLTVGTQAVTFGFEEMMEGSPVALSGGGQSDPSGYIFATFYLGTACASVVYGLMKVRLRWPYGALKAARRVTVFVGVERKHKRRIAFHWLSLGGTAALFLSITVNLFRMDEKAAATAAVMTLCSLALIAAAAFIYELLALALFDHIGAEAKRLNQGKLVALAYGFMGVGVTVTLLLVGNYLGSAGDNVQLKAHLQVQGHRYLLYILTGCLFAANLAIAFAPNARRRRARFSRRPSEAEAVSPAVPAPRPGYTAPDAAQVPAVSALADKVETRR